MGHAINVGDRQNQDDRLSRHIFQRGSLQDKVDHDLCREPMNELVRTARLAVAYVGNRVLRTALEYDLRVRNRIQNRLFWFVKKLKYRFLILRDIRTSSTNKIQCVLRLLI